MASLAHAPPSAATFSGELFLAPGEADSEAWQRSVSGIIRIQVTADP